MNWQNQAAGLRLWRFMKQVHVGKFLVPMMILLCAGLIGQAQQTLATNINVVVPPLVNFSGVLTDVNGKPLTEITGVTFYLYKDEQGGAPLWMETQNVQPDKTGHYTVMLGSTSSTGLPADIFVAGEAHWLGVQVQGLGQGQSEQPRVLLLSVPYAFKAGDAQTLGGLPASAFVQATPAAKSGAAGTGTTSNQTKASIEAAITGTGKTNYVPLWTSASNLGESLIYQKGKEIGINTTTPDATLDVKGNNGSEVLQVTQSGIGSAIVATANGAQGSAIIATTNTTEGVGVSGTSTSTTSSAIGGIGVSGSSANPIGYGVSGTSPNVGVYGSGTGSGGIGVDGHGTFIGAKGIATATSGASQGVYGQTSSSGGYGVEGTGPNVGVYGVSSVASKTGAGFCCAGVWGDTGVPFNGVANGVLGTADDNNAGHFQNNSPSGAPALEALANSTSSNAIAAFGATICCSKEWVSLSDGGASVGVWGDTGEAPGTATAVIGTADDNWAARFFNNSASHTTLNAQNDTTTTTALVFHVTGGTVGGSCTIDVSGNLKCTGSKSAVVPVDGGARKVTLYAVEAPENWFEDFGSGTLANGVAIVRLDPTFAQTVNTRAEYHVFLTPKGDSEGLYVSNETPRGFEVHEQRGGHSNVAFDYRIVAKRNGFENVRLEDVSEEYRQFEAERALHEQNRREHPMPQRLMRRPAAGPIAAAEVAPHK